MLHLPEPDRRAAQEVLRKLTGSNPDLIAAVIVEAGGDVQVEMAAGEEAVKLVDLGPLARRLAERLGGRGGGRGSRASLRVPAGSVSRLEDELASLLEESTSQQG